MSGLEAAATVATIVGIVASPLFQKALDFLEAHLTRNKMQWKLHPPLSDPQNELRALEDAMGNIPVLLQMARSINDNTRGIAKFLAQLREVSYAVEDLVDELQYEELCRKVLHHDSDPSLERYHDSYQSLKRYLLECFTCNGAATLTANPLQSQVTVDRVRKSVEDLDRLSGHLKEACALGRTLRRTKPNSGGSMILAHRVTTSTVDSHMVYGRDNEKENIAKLITNPILSGEGDTRPELSIIGITGVGGMGKTTLAQYVLNDEDVHKCFDFIVWICVSDDYRRDRVLKEIVRDISTSLGNTDRKIESITNIDTLEKMLKNDLEGKRLLLVLDDVWSNDWTEILLPLQVSGKCSKIIVTTRERKNIQLSGSIAAPNYKALDFNLDGLEDGIYLSLFEKYAFGDQNPNDHPRLQSIGQQIAKKLRGSPLAAKTVGAVLRESLDIQCWDQVLNNELWELGKNEAGDIMPALLLSYLHLPTHLQRCFSYCALFPKDYKFDKVCLVNMWIAQGYVSSLNDERLEEVGVQYFEELEFRSFFIQLDEWHLMHDLIHDMALFVSLDEFYVKFWMKYHGHPETTHHLSVQCTIEALTDPLLNRLKHVRTVSTIGGQVTSQVGVLKIIEALRSVRVLVLKDHDKVDSHALLGSMSHLIHLRYLDFSGIRLKKVPESICSLHHLQTLILQNYLKIEFPQRMGNLVNLRHLVANKDSIANIPNIGKLSCLQELELFHVRHGEQYNLGQFEEMNELGGDLCIRILAEVETMKDAKLAKLDKKKRINRLILDWQFDHMSNEHHHDDILECLQPHYLLDTLKIYSHLGSRPPSWLASHSLKFIRSIHLRLCWRWNGHLHVAQLPYLQYLEIITCGSLVIELGDEDAFPSLEKLELVHVSVSFCGHTPKSLFPCLQIMHLTFCSKLEGLYLPPSLKELSIENSFLDLPGCLQGLSSLTSLKISHQDSFTSFDDAELMASLRMLKKLEIRYCRNFQPPPLGFPPLEELEILC